MNLKKNSTSKIIFRVKVQVSVYFFRLWSGTQHWQMILWQATQWFFSEVHWRPCNALFTFIFCNWCCRNLPWLFHTFWKWACLRRQLSPVSHVLISYFYFHSFMHAISFFIFYPVSPCPPAARPYHLPLNECAAGSFVNNQCHRNTKERTKPFTPLQKDFGQGNYWKRDWS